MKQGDRSVNEFFTDMKIVWEDLEALRPIPICSCNVRCNCDTFKIMHNQREIEYAICFLKGLNDSYSTVRSQILLMKPLPTISEVFSLIIQQEDHLAGTSSSQPTVLYNASERPTQGRGIFYSGGRGPLNNSRGRGRGRSYPGGRGNPKQCTFCSRHNHTVEQCYFKHDFPPGYKPRYQSSTNSIAASDGNTSSNTEASLPKAVSHDAPGAPLGEQLKQILNLLQHSNIDQSMQNTSATINTSYTNAIESSTQHDNSGISVHWILDTGATDHVTSSKELFTTFRCIKPINVSLPNGSKVFAQYSGTIYFSDDFQLYNVLYIPNFTLNIISVHRLISTLHCKLTFLDSTCHIQDAINSKMIGLAKLCNGLYYLQVPSCPLVPFSLSTKQTHSVNSTSSNVPNSHFDIWHFRLGHPSHKVLTNICNVFSIYQIQ